MPLHSFFSFSKVISFLIPTNVCEFVCSLLCSLPCVLLKLYRVATVGLCWPCTSLDSSGQWVSHGSKHQAVRAGSQLRKQVYGTDPAAGRAWP